MQLFHRVEAFNELIDAATHHGQSHLTPQELLVEAKTVVCYFIPFEISIVKSNASGTRCSKQWARAYLETMLSNGPISMLPILPDSGNLDAIIC